MDALLLLIFQPVLLDIVVSSPFLVATPKWHNDATTYCNNYCGSGFLSIHSIQENERAIEIINNSLDTLSIFIEDTVPYNNHNENPIYISDVWHGLHRINNDFATNFAWSDGTAFDFGTTGNIYPWHVDEPNNLESGEWCGHFWMAKNKNWNDFICDSNLRFMCNNCNGKLNKYIVIHYDRNYTNAQSFCNQYLGTTLATIHSNDDYQAAKALLAVNNDKDYWMGLNDFQINPEGNFDIWDDGSYLDWAQTFGKYPWGESSNEPNGGVGENCIEFQGVQAYYWNDKNCDERHPFICNLPSELCVTNNWNTYGDMYWSSNNCDVYSNNNSVSIINNKQWIYSDSIWVIEYLYTIRNVSGINYNGNNETYGESGIMLYHFDTVCDYYFIGIAISNNTAYIFIYKSFNYRQTILYYSPIGLFTYIYERFYTLKVKLTYSTHIQFDISINNNHTITYNDTTSNLYVNHTKFIGLKNVHATIISKSLYASDTPKYTFSDNLSFTQCTPQPTTYPTTITNQPTFNPTVNPTHVPVFHPTINPTIQPTTNMPTSKQPTTMNPTTANPTITEATVTDEGKEYIIIIEAEYITHLDVDTVEKLVTDEINDIDVSDVIMEDDSIKILFSVSSNTHLDTEIIQKDIENTLENEYDQDITVTIESNETENENLEKSPGFFDNTSYIVLTALVSLLLIITCILIGCLVCKRRNMNSFQKSVSNIELHTVQKKKDKENKLNGEKDDVLATPLNVASQPQNIGTLSSNFNDFQNSKNTINTITPFTVTSFIPNNSMAINGSTLPDLELDNENTDEDEEELYQSGAEATKGSTNL